MAKSKFRPLHDRVVVKRIDAEEKTDIASTFVDDAAALVAGLGRAVLKFAMRPIDRIANACDIAGVLTERRATFRMWRASRARSRHAGRRFSLLGRLSPFRHLAHLT